VSEVEKAKKVAARQKSTQERTRVRSFVKSPTPADYEPTPRRSTAATHGDSMVDADEKRAALEIVSAGVAEMMESPAG